VQYAGLVCLYERHKNSVFAVGFTENQKLLEVVWGQENRVISSIERKMGEKALILEKGIARSLYHYSIDILFFCGFFWKTKFFWT